MGYFSLILGSIAVILISRLWKYVDFIWKTYIITKNLKNQGVAGPNYKFPKGNIEEIDELKKGAYVIEQDINSHDYSSRVVPHYFKWVNQCGGMFLYWIGSTPSFCVTDPELVKQVLSNKFGSFPMQTTGAQFEEILGKLGLVLIDGNVWATQRRIVSPAFTMDKLKVTSPYGTTLHCRENVKSGQFAFTTTEPGSYLTCFWIYNSDKGVSASINPGWKMKDWDLLLEKKRIVVLCYH